MKFYTNIFFPYIEENNITTVIHAGDFLDRRRYVNFNTLNRIRKEFLSVLFDKYGIKMHCIPGNHDTYYKNTNEVNSMKEIFESQYPDDFILYEKPTVVGSPLLVLGQRAAWLPLLSGEGLSLASLHDERGAYVRVSVVDLPVKSTRTQNEQRRNKQNKEVSHQTSMERTE